MIRGEAIAMSILIGVVLLVACTKKDEDPKCSEVTPVDQPGMAVVTPSPYLPAYPGSWWEYSDGSRITTGGSYSLEPVLSTAWDPNYGVTHCCSGRNLWMPTYDGHLLYGYVRMNPGALGSNGPICNEQLLSEQLGEAYRWGGDHYGRTTLKTMATDTTIVLADGRVYSPCIMVKRVDGLHSNNFDHTWPYELTFYARNIGLIKEVQVLLDSTVLRRELSAYHIAY